MADQQQGGLRVAIARFHPRDHGHKPRRDVVVALPALDSRIEVVVLDPQPFGLPVEGLGLLAIRLALEYPDVILAQPIRHLGREPEPPADDLCRLECA